MARLFGIIVAAEILIVVIFISLRLPKIDLNENDKNTIALYAFILFDIYNILTLVLVLRYLVRFRKKQSKNRFLGRMLLLYIILGLMIWIPLMIKMTVILNFVILIFFLPMFRLLWVLFRRKNFV